MSTAARTGFDRRLLAPMILGSILNPINSSIIAIALVPIGRDLGEPASATSWLVAGLYLATAIGQPLAGKLVDRFGPRPVFLVGTAAVGLAGLGGMVANGLGALVAARVLLGLGTCAGYPSSMVLIRGEAERTGRDSPAGALTALAIANQTIAVIGPTLGGLLIGVGGWRATFAVNLPLSAACLVLGAAFLPRRRGAAAGPLRLDAAGILLFAGTLTTLLLFLMTPSPTLIWLLGAAALLGSAFAVVELRVAHPFIDLRMLAANRPLLASYGRMALGAMLGYTVIYGFAQWIEDARGLSPAVAGLVVLPTFGVAILASALTGRDPRLRGKLVVGSVVFLAVGAALLAVDRGEPIWILVALSALVGVPQGLLNLANQNAVYAQAAAAGLGQAAGLLRTFMYLGAIAAATVTGGVFGERPSDAGLHVLGWCLVGVAAALLVLTLADRSLRGLRPIGSKGPG